MDLSNIADLLDDFATFAGAIETFLTAPVELLSFLSSTDAGVEAEDTSNALEAFSS